MLRLLDSRTACASFVGSAPDTVVRQTDRHLGVWTRDAKRGTDGESSVARTREISMPQSQRLNSHL